MKVLREMMFKVSKSFAEPRLQRFILLLTLIACIPLTSYSQSRQELEKQRLQLQKEIKYEPNVVTVFTRSIYESHIAEIDGIRVLGDGDYHLVAMATDPDSAVPVDVFALGDALLERGWFHDRQGPPDSLHSTVSNSNTGVIDQYLSDLAECVDAVRGDRADDRSTNYSTVE